MRRFLRAAVPLAATLLLAVPALAQVAPSKAVSPSFKELDADRNARVSLDEVMAFAKKRSTLVEPFNVAGVDLDKDGKLTQEELNKAGIKGLEHEGVINVRDLDMSADGYVSREDLDEYFRRKHREEYARADADKDGSLKQSEFALFRF